MITAIIIDDEPRSRMTLSTLLERYCPGVAIAGYCANVQEGIKVLTQAAPDLVFLDISMPDGNGIELLEEIRDKKFEVIFTTAYSEYALQAIKANAIDYLLKPINIKELQDAVKKAEQKIEDKNSLIAKHTISETAKTSHSTGKIAIPVNDGLQFIPVSSIVRLEAEGSYTRIISTNATVLSSKPLKDFEAMLPADIFFRAHHSHIINIDQIKHYHRGEGGYVTMTDGSVIDISKRKKKLFLELFQQ